MEKITFDDKLSTLDINSKYVFTADNVNEIKDAVNSLADNISETSSFDSICKYISITLPETLEDINYSLNVHFLDENRTISNQFLIFENGEFKVSSSNFITKADESKTILIKTPDTIKSSSVNVYYSLSGENEINYPLGYSTFKKVSLDLPKSKYFIISNEDDLKTFKYAINHNYLKELKDRINFQFNSKQDDKYLTILSSIVYIDENHIDVSSEIVSAILFNFELSGIYSLNKNNISIAQIPNDIPSKNVIEKFSSLTSGSQQIGNYYTIFNSNEFKSVNNNFTSSVLISANQTYDNSRYVLLSSNNDEYIIKELNKYPIELRVDFNKDTLESNNDQISFTASLIYSDGASGNVTNNVISRPLNENINLIIIDNNTISLSSETTQQETKYIIFSYKLDNNMTLYDIKKINIS